MSEVNSKVSLRNLYHKVLENKIISICVLFTMFTLLDAISILLGWWPAKIDLGPYVHLVGRFVLHTILVYGLYFYDILTKMMKSKIIVYGIVFLVTWGSLLFYLKINSFFIELHSNAYIDATISYAFMYFLLGIVVLTTNLLIFKKEKSHVE